MVCELKNEIGLDNYLYQDGANQNSDNFKLKAIVFTCKSEERKKELLFETKFEIVGPYLV